MSDLQALAESQNVDPELIPSIVPVDARISFGAVTADVLSMVSRIASITPSKEVVPGTSMMLVEAIAEAGSVPHLRISASDGDQWMQVFSSQTVRVLMPGAVVVPAKKILEALKAAPERVLKLSAIGSSVSLQSGRALWRFATPISDRLNTTPVHEDVEMVEVAAGGLRSALRAVSASADPRSARAAFLQAHVAQGAVTTTDGARLHRQTIPGLPEAFTTDIPTKALSQIIALLEPLAGDATVLVGATERRIVFHIEESKIIAQRILLPFPDIESIIIGAGISNEKSFTVLTEELKAAVRRVRINSDPDYSAILLRLTPLPGDRGWGLGLSSQDKNGNEASEVVEAQWNGIKAREFAVNHKHLTDLLNQLPSEYCTVRVGDDTKTQKSPLLVEDSGFRGVLAQMSVNWGR